MKKKIYKTFHKTRVNYSYVVLSNGKTFTETSLLDNWLSNITYISTKINEIISSKSEECKVYAINSIEHVRIRSFITDLQFESVATMDDESLVVIRKLR